MSAPRSRLAALLPKGRFAGRVATLAGGTAFGQAVLIASAPILTRLFTPDDIGVLAVYAGILAVLAVLASARYELAIPLPDDERTASNLVALALLLVGITTSLTTVLVATVGGPLAGAINTPELAGYLWLLPFSVVLTGTYQVFNYWSTRHGRFGLLGATKASQGVGRAGVQLAGGALGWGTPALFAGHLTGLAVGVGAVARRNRPAVSLITRARIRAAARRYANFPRYTVWEGTFGVAGVQAPPVLFAAYFSLEMAGFYGLTMRVLGLPASILGQAVMQVFYPTAADRVDDARAARTLVTRVATALLGLALPVFAFVTLLGPDLFALVFGEEWREAGRIARYIAPWLAVAFLTAPLATFAFVKGRQRRAMLTTLAETGLRLGALIAGGLTGSVSLALALFAAAGSLIGTVYLAWVLRLSGSGIGIWLGSIWRQVVAAAAVIGALAVITPLLTTVAAIAVCAVALGGLAVWWRRSTRDMIVAG